MTARDLLDNQEFLAFCSCWQKDGRCPIGLADWLRERNLPGQGDAAQWAAMEPDRPEHSSVNWGGICPIENDDRPDDPLRQWEWCPEHPYPLSRCRIPKDVFKAMSWPDSQTHFELHATWKSWSSFPRAIAAMLDAWAAARGPNFPEPETRKCWRCRGTGRVLDSEAADHNERIGKMVMVPPMMQCFGCGGTGRITDAKLTAKPRKVIR